MDVNGWLTVITVFAAVIALLPKEDLFVRFYGTSEILKWLFGIINLIIIPYLLFFEKIAQRCTFLEKCTFQWGIDPKNIAFALFYISFIWLLAHLLFSKPKAKTDEKFFNFFKELLNEKPFEEFFKLFTKYTSEKDISDNWPTYKDLIFKPKFLDGLLKSRLTYLLQFWKKFSNENDFQSIFRLFLENPNSAYYTELKEHYNSYSLLDDKPFLNTVIKENLKLSIDNGILMVFSDHVLTHLQKEHDQTSIYNQKHYDPRIRKDEGFNLPVYYHIRFIGLLYNYLIENRVNISTMTDKTTMLSYYPDIVSQMINNMNLVENIDIEYPSNYHRLIGEIFSLQSNWLILFCDVYSRKPRYFDEKSSFVSFIPSSISDCLRELYKGLEDNRISTKFINHRAYDSIFVSYFYIRLDDKMRTSIEEEVIGKIPKKLIDPIFTYALDKRFAVKYSNFKEGNLTRGNRKEEEILNRLYDFLKDEDMI